MDKKEKERWKAQENANFSFDFFIWVRYIIWVTCRPLSPATFNGGWTLNIVLLNHIFVLIFLIDCKLAPFQLNKKAVYNNLQYLSVYRKPLSPVVATEARKEQDCSRTISSHVRTSLLDFCNEIISA